MAYIDLSGITGCIYPTTGVTTGYGIKYNKNMISAYHKKDITINTVNKYIVVITIDGHMQQFQFLNSSDRDSFYNSI